MVSPVTRGAAADSLNEYYAKEKAQFFERDRLQLATKLVQAAVDELGAAFEQKKMKKLAKALAIKMMDAAKEIAIEATQNK
jgi:hypothetical protein